MRKKFSPIVDVSISKDCCGCRGCKEKEDRDASRATTAVAK